MSDIVSSFVVADGVLYANLMPTYEGPRYSLSAPFIKGADGELYVVFPDSEDLEHFLEAIGYDPEERYTFGGDTWEDNAFSFNPFYYWAKKEGHHMIVH